MSVATVKAIAMALYAKPWLRRSVSEPADSADRRQPVAELAIAEADSPAEPLQSARETEAEAPAAAAMAATALSPPASALDFEAHHFSLDEADAVEPEPPASALDFEAHHFSLSEDEEAAQPQPPENIRHAHNEASCQVCRLINDGYIQPASASAALECQICGDVRLLHRVQADASVEQWPREYSEAKHMACADCLCQWVEGQLETLHPFVRCPFPNCEERMHLDDIHGVDPDLAYWMQLRMVEEHKQMGAPFTDEEMAEMREGGDIILGKCPNCSLLIERIEGCSEMICVCGTSFCYICGQSVDECGGECE